MPRNGISLEPENFYSLVKLEGNTSSQHVTDTETRVVDYGDQAWARNSTPPDSEADSSGFIGLADPIFQAVMPSTEELTLTLKDSLEQAMVTAYPDDKQTFLPLGQLKSLCHQIAVRRQFVLIFGETSPDIDRYTDYVCGNGSKGAENTSLKLFAILVLIGKAHTIETFIEEGVKDRHLPFRKSLKDTTTDDFILYKRTTLDRSSPIPMICFNNWYRVDKRKFYEEQWRLLSPYFSRAVDGSLALYELDEQAILPWTSTGEEKKGSFEPLEKFGGFSKVTQVTIHPDHHTFDAKKCAIKELFDPDETPFANEFGNLQKVQMRKHLLPLYTAYRRGQRYNFVFPWADGGSLMELWTTEPRSLKPSVLVKEQGDDDAKRGKAVVAWVASQLSGLTGEFGLGFLHDTKFLEPPQPELAVPDSEKRYGIHGDIKPGNILYFRQDHGQDEFGLGVLKLSDFGITGFHSAFTKSRKDPTGPHSPTYRAPEYAMLQAYLSRKYDIWGLGCVLLQFLTWFISGPEALKQFNEDRLAEEKEASPQFAEDKFFMITQPEDPSGPRTDKSSVQGHIDALQKIVGQGNYLHDCLELIRTKMLQIKVEERADCEELHHLLAGYHQKCLRDSEYLTATLPTFIEPKIRTTHHQVPAIFVTNHTSNPQIEAYNTVSSDGASNISADPYRSRASTNNAPITTDETTTGQGDAILIQRDGPGVQSKNTETQEKHRSSKTKRILGICFPIPWRRRGPDVSK